MGCNVKIFKKNPGEPEMEKKLFVAWNSIVIWRYIVVPVNDTVSIDF